MNAILISFLLVFPLFIIGQANKNSLGIIRGTVLTADGQVASNVSVSIKNTGKGTITDINGNFEIRNINPGIYSLSILLNKGILPLSIPPV
jgi:iron complex outermembrane receptor protein